MSSHSDKTNPNASEMSETESTKGSEEVTTCGTIESNSSHESEVDNESNDSPHPDEQPGFEGGEQSVLDPSPTVEALSPSRSSNKGTKKRKRSGPHEGGRPAPAAPTLSTHPSKRDEEPRNPRVKREATPTPPPTELTPHSGTQIDDEESDASGLDTSESAIERAESEAAEEVEDDRTKRATKASARTALPNGKPNSGLSLNASTRPLGLAKRGSKWSADEDAVLLRLLRLRTEERLTWDQVSAQLPGRSTIACRRRSGLITGSHSTAPRRKVAAPIHPQAPNGPENPTSPAAVVVKGRWTHAEMDELNHLKASDVEWPDICKQLGGRTVAACRRKWENMRRVANASSSGGATDALQESRAAEEDGDVESSSGSDEEGSQVAAAADDDDVEAGSVFDEAASDSTTSDEDSSESRDGDGDGDENETEWERKRKHALFFLNR